MKLAEALILRADLQRRLAQLQRRLFANAKVQKGETPAEDPEALLAELDALTAQLASLMTRINLTNAKTVDGGETMTALLAQRDCLRTKENALREFLSEASSVVMRGTRSEVIVKSTVSVAALQKRSDALSKELRELDTRIQSLNWTTEID